MLLEDKKGTTITHAFQKFLKDYNRKLNKTWVDGGSEFYNESMKSWLEKNDIDLYSIYNKGKPVFDERFIRTLKNKSYKYTSSISEKCVNW